MRLHAVATPLDAALLGRAGVLEGRRLAQHCLDRSVRLAGAPHPPPASGDSAQLDRLPNYPRNSAGAPVPYAGAACTWHWSTTNTHGLAAGVVAPVPVALDAEWRGRPRLEAVRSYLDGAELALAPSVDAPPELVLWTLKEAVLKLTGLGLSGLGRCHLVRTLNTRPGHLEQGHEEPGHARAEVELDGELYVVHSRIHGEHVLALAAASADVNWELSELEAVTA